MSLLLSNPKIGNSWDEFHAFLNFTTLKIEILNKFPTTQALELSLRQKDTRKSVAAFLNKFPVTTIEGKPITDISLFRSSIILLDSHPFGMLNEATAEEHEIQHLLDLAGSTAGFYLLAFFLQEMEGDIHWLNRLALYDSVHLPLRTWLDSPDTGKSKDSLRKYLLIRELSRVGLASMVTQRLFRVTPEILKKRMQDELFVRYRNEVIGSAYYLPHAVLYESSSTPYLVPVNFTTIMECKALLKQLAIIAQFLSPVAAGMSIVYLMNNIMSSATYLGPLIPYLHKLGINEENPILQELTIEHATSKGISQEAGTLALAWSARLAQDYTVLYDLCDWALMGDFSLFTDKTSINEQRNHYIESEPGCRFAIALESSLARHSSSIFGYNSFYSHKLDPPAQYRKYEMSGIEFAVKYLKNIDNILSNQAVAEFTHHRYKIIQHLGLRLFEHRYNTKGKLNESTTNFLECLNIMGRFILFQKSDRRVLLPKHPEIDDVILVSNTDVASYFAKMLEDLLDRRQIKCPEDDCQHKNNCDSLVLPKPPSYGFCAFGSYVQSLLGDVKFVL